MATSYDQQVAAPKFFKTELDPTLIIPPEFTKRIGHNLPNPVFLKVATGPTMEVELVQSDGQTTLQKGWKEFRERYSIDIGHLLVFEYNVCKSEFNVVVFDKSAVEINYSVDTDYNSKRTANKEPNLGDAGSKDKAQSQENTARRDVEVIEISSSSERDSKPKLDESSSEESWDGIEIRGPVAKETSVAYQKAMVFVRHDNPNNNPYFISLLQKSYVSGDFVLNVPLSFARRNFPGVGSSTIIVVVDDEKKWRVRCTVRKMYTKLSTGWKQFVRDNGLKVGDACVFHVADDYNTKYHVWNVAIFRSCD